jgi:diketogulonate reductase-like aldo/keto reductase
MKSNLLTLNNGVKIPALGLGVYQSTPELKALCSFSNTQNA